LFEAGELDRERSEPDPLLAGVPEIDWGGLVFWERAVLLDKYQKGRLKPNLNYGLRSVSFLGKGSGA
jgi:hypothetical protein